MKVGGVSIIYDEVRIEKRKDGSFWVLDKRGPSIVEQGPFPSMDVAREVWGTYVDAILEERTCDAIFATSDEDALARRWPKPLTR